MEDKKMRTITSTIPTSTINVQEVSFKDGKLEGKALDPVIVKGEEVTQEKASKFVKDTYGKEKSFVVTGIDVKEEV
jgi:hypothetical protein